MVKREIQILHLLLLDIDEKYKNNNTKFNNVESLINAVEQILIGKDAFVYNIVNKLSTSL